MNSATRLFAYVYVAHGVPTAAASITPEAASPCDQLTCHVTIDDPDAGVDPEIGHAPKADVHVTWRVNGIPSGTDDRLGVELAASGMVVDVPATGLPVNDGDRVSSSWASITSLRSSSGSWSRASRSKRRSGWLSSVWCPRSG